jgi:small-conductance mechanosensitive channel
VRGRRGEIHLARSEAGSPRDAANFPGVDSNLAKALVSAAIWIVVLVVVRYGLRYAFDRYERRLAERDPAVAARRRTTFSFLLRFVIALVGLIGVWSVLSVFPATQQVASAFLASSAVLAVIAGLALTTPLGNLGSGVLLAFTQPVRLGDRITVDDHTGIVEEISLSYTALKTDEGRRIFVPNTRMVSTTLVNRSVDDPRRLVTVELPVRLGAPLDEARRIAMEAAAKVPQGESLAVYVQVGQISEQTAWLNVVAYAPFGADVSQVASEIREKALFALGEAELLPT